MPYIVRQKIKGYIAQSAYRRQMYYSDGPNKYIVVFYIPWEFNKKIEEEHKKTANEILESFRLN